jgi:hypothetical protein
MTTKVEKLAKKINESYRDLLAAKFKEKFGLDIVTSFNLGTMSLVSQRMDRRNFTRAQKEFIWTFEAGYIAAMNQVHE